MQQRLRITFHGIEGSEAVERRIRAKAAELEQFYDNITSCHVTVDASHLRHHKGNLYSVRMDIHVPGQVIVVGRDQRRQSHEDVYVAIRDAFDAAVRQIEDYARVRRRQVKRHEVPDHGRVTKLFPQDGYGFVYTSDGTEVYFHENSVTGVGFDALEVGDEVRVVVAEGESEEGPRASTVTPIGKHHILGTNAS